MRILISVDMEGISGVTTWDQVTPGHAEHARFRRQMTEDANAAVRGAFAGSADEVIVSDGHWHGSNILVEELDGRAVLNSGSPSAFSMMQGIGPGIDGVLFVGYHARHGSHPAVLDHTWSDTCVSNVWLNDALAGEYTLNAAIAGHFGVPVLMVSGDQAACAEAANQLGNIETAVVKHATGRYAAECLPPSITLPLIEGAAERAVKRLAEKPAPAPYIVKTPVNISVELAASDMADRAMLLPGSRRAERCVSFTSENMVDAYAAFRALVLLSYPR